MNSRRRFIRSGVINIAGISLMPAINLFAKQASPVPVITASASKLRFAVASDGHFGQPGTDGDKFYGDLIQWLTSEHKESKLDFVVINGDLVHDRPDLLQHVRTTFLEKLPVPYYTVPGNHDFADATLWKDVFGYEDNHTAQYGDTGLVFANTADTHGKYICPDYKFLKASLDGFEDKRMVFVFLHIAPHRWLPEEEKIFLECPEINHLLQNYPNIKAVFHGHDHSLDVVRYTDKLPHIFDGHFGGNWGTEYKGYRIVEVAEDNAITTWQVNGSRNPIINKNSF